MGRRAAPWLRYVDYSKSFWCEHCSERVARDGPDWVLDSAGHVRHRACGYRMRAVPRQPRGGRLAAARGLRRFVRRLGPNVWRVLNRGRVHYVRGGPEDVVCDCEDNLFRRGKCKHILAVELKEGTEFKVNPNRHLNLEGALAEAGGHG